MGVIDDIARENIKKTIPLIEGIEPKELIEMIEDNYNFYREDSIFYKDIFGKTKAVNFWVSKKPMVSKIHKDTIYGKKPNDFYTVKENILNQFIALKVTNGTKANKFYEDFEGVKMTIKEITKYFNIPASTFHEWNKIGHKKYELTLLLLALPLEQVKTILEKTKQELTPKYSENTRFIILNKKLFDSDLLWTTQDKQKIEISKLITIYMNRATQKEKESYQAPQSLLQKFRWYIRSYPDR
jgi:hypothetical protein